VRTAAVGALNWRISSSTSTGAGPSACSTALRMRSEDYEKNSKQFPALESFVSANLTPLDPAVRPFQPYVIREVRGARLGADPVRVGFLGLTEAPLLNGRTAERLGAYRIGDPVEAAKQLVPELRKNSRYNTDNDTIGSHGSLARYEDQPGSAHIDNVRVARRPFQRRRVHTAHSGLLVGHVKCPLSSMGSVLKRCMSGNRAGMWRSPPMREPQRAVPH